MLRELSSFDAKLIDYFESIASAPAKRLTVTMQEKVTTLESLQKNLESKEQEDKKEKERLENEMTHITNAVAQLKEI